MNRKLIEDLHQYFEQMDNKNGSEVDFLNRVIEELPYFQIAVISRDDLAQIGFDGEKVDDCDMTELAQKVGNSYTEMLCRESLKTLAVDMGIPKIRYSICPKCEKQIDSRKNSCRHCGETWSEDTYVLVEFPDDSSYFEQEGIGYSCFNSQDNGARYVSEYEYILQFGKKPNDNQYFKPIQWPDSQRYFDLEEKSKSVFELCEPIIADDKALNDFGDSAIWVPSSITKKKK